MLATDYTDDVPIGSDLSLIRVIGFARKVRVIWENYSRKGAKRCRASRASLRLCGFAWV